MSVDEIRKRLDRYGKLPCRQDARMPAVCPECRGTADTGCRLAGWGDEDVRDLLGAVDALQEENERLERDVCEEISNRDHRVRQIERIAAALRLTCEWSNLCDVGDEAEAAADAAWSEARSLRAENERLRSVRHYGYALASLMRKLGIDSAELGPEHLGPVEWLDIRVTSNDSGELTRITVRRLPLDEDGVARGDLRFLNEEPQQ